MPIFEYRCSGCGRRFEQLVTTARAAACPSCKGKKLEKQHSVFAVASGRGASPAAEAPSMGAGCGTCGDPRGPGSCADDD